MKKRLLLVRSELMRTTRRKRVVIRYGECQRNHAASMGGHTVDGCREFMADGEEGMMCAACGCHRNFHRRVVEYYGCPERHQEIMRR